MAIANARADLLSFGFAAHYLPEADAIAIFLYNVLLRFGSHLEGVDQRGCHSYGAIPFMLFGLLYRAGFVRPARGGEGDRLFVISSLEPAAVIRQMNTLSNTAREDLVESPSLQATDSALAAATFYRSLLDDETVSPFDRAIVLSSRAHSRRLSENPRG
jgi:hypothetical protein